MNALCPRGLPVSFIATPVPMSGPSVHCGTSGIGAADGKVVEEEREFLRRVIERFHLTQDDRADRIVASDPGRATATLRALPSDVQSRVMALLVEAAIVDGRVEPEERALLLASAAT